MMKIQKNTEECWKTDCLRSHPLITNDRGACRLHMLTLENNIVLQYSILLTLHLLFQD